MTNQQTESVKTLKARMAYLQRELSHTKAQLLDYEENGTYNEIRRENNILKEKLKRLEGENLVLFELLTKSSNEIDKAEHETAEKFDSWFMSNLKSQAAKDNGGQKE
ncbi:hypothetical protein [Metabacillus idriensis]|uniref:hypothetical protein n=1 Tax=Metabacillus idriensis TaxID=324768 RepID=UPI003D2C2F21